MQCTDNNNGENQKIIRGRFIIQEIIDTQSNQNSNSDSDSDSSPFRYADVFIDTFQPKKRRNSQNNSKFKLNSIKESQISNSQFLVYDHQRKSYVDINEVFQKYEYKIPIKHNITKSKRLLSLIIENQEDELIINNKDNLNNNSNNNNSNKDVYTGILKKNDVKRIESISNLAEHRVLNDFEKKESLPTSNNNISNSNNNNERKLKSPSKRFLSMNDKKNQLIEQRVISYLIESQHFNECSIASCQFSLCGNNNHTQNNCNVELVVA